MSKQDVAALAKKLAELLAQQEQPANDDEPAIDEAAIRERMRQVVERARRARNQR